MSLRFKPTLKLTYLLQKKLKLIYLSGLKKYHQNRETWVSIKNKLLFKINNNNEQDTTIFKSAQSIGS